MARPGVAPPCPPERRAWGEIHEQAEARDHGRQCTRDQHADDSPPDVRRRAQRHEACATSVGKPRSTTQRVCFMTSSDVTTTSVAGEVKLYLALPFFSSSRLALPRLVASSSSVPLRARFRLV